MLERLSYNTEGKFWKGPDVVTSKDVLLNRHADVPVIITRDSLPSLSGLPPEALRNVRVSIRSRYAQLGIDINEAAGEQIAQSIIQDGHQAMDGTLKGQFETPVLLFNLCARPVSIPKGTHLFRFFFESIQPIVSGENLISLIDAGEIKVGGESGLDWVWSYKNKSEHTENNIVGIYMRIKPEGRRWIPPHVSDDPISINNEGDYREKIDALLRPIPQNYKEILWIGETESITLGKSVDVVLDSFVRQNIYSLYVKGLGIQINSRLIDGDKTHWPIRVEVLSRTSVDRIPNYVHLSFFRNGN